MAQGSKPRRYPAHMVPPFTQSGAAGVIHHRFIACGEIVTALPVAALVVCAHTDVDQAHRLWRRHRACTPHTCVVKRAALQILVLAGKVVPQTVSLRDRAAGRGIDLEDPPEPAAPMLTLGTAELLAMLEGLART
ncbi:hypothetical protein [Nocardia sp. BMG111209]|uniref:hypothetical protein n=1 Tax=Nocardia sp. BMG111209 TaxID=1160137 RepID=UPI0012DEF945|nr:hypothetical protein [Nocardia sp. BMG111209]